MKYCDWDGWSKEELIRYLDFLMHNYRVVDGFWFLNVESRHGHEEACKINELVWERSAYLASVDLIKKFNIHEKGLKGFLRLLKLIPWTIMVGYDYIEKEDELIIRVPSCPPQEARLKKGMGEYDCKDMHMAEFKSIVKAIDESIQITCDFAPPGEHPEDCYCQWRFKIKE